MSDTIIVNEVIETRVVAIAEQGPPGPPGSTAPKVDLTQGLFDSDNITVSVLGDVILHAFPYTQYGAAKYIIYVTLGLQRQICELLLLHDGTFVQAVEYANMVTDSLLSTFSVDISSGFVRLVGSPTSVGINYRIIRTLIDN